MCRNSALIIFCLFQILEHQKVAKQFLLLNTTLGKALDKSSSLDISDEVREQVNFNTDLSSLFLLISLYF